MANVIQSKPISSPNACDAIFQSSQVCGADLKPESKCVRNKLTHISTPATKVWLMGRCVNGVIIYSYEGDNGATPISAPNGVVLSGAFGDWIQVECPKDSSAPPPAPTPPPPPVSGIDCAGAPVTAPGTQTVPHPTAVQPTKDCGNPVRDALLASILAELKKPEFDREFIVLCDPTGERIAVQNTTPEDAPIGTAPTFSTWGLGGGTWVGDITTLKDCGAEQVDISSAAFFCAGGVEYSRTDFFDVTKTPKVLTGSLWQDVSGAVVAPPTSPVAGRCEAATLTPNPIHWCDPSGVCVEGKAWYETKSGTLVRINTIKGIDVTATVSPLTIYEGACPEQQHTDRKLCVRMPAIAPALVGEKWEVIERTITSKCAPSKVVYLDPDVTPMVEVTIESIIASGDCPCCEGV
jgi:hypothetical protein